MGVDKIGVDKVEINNNQIQYFVLDRQALANSADPVICTFSTNFSQERSLCLIFWVMSKLSGLLHYLLPCSGSSLIDEFINNFFQLF